MVRMNFQIRWSIKRIVIPSEVEESRRSTERSSREILRLRCASLGMTVAGRNEKTRIEISIRVF